MKKFILAFLLGLTFLMLSPSQSQAEQQSLYFKVVKDVDVYDNRTGKLISIGIVEENTVLQMRRIEGNWISFYVGEEYYYLHMSAVELLTGPDIASKFSMATNSNIFIKNSSNVNVYENISKEKVIFTLFPRSSFPVLRENGDFLEVLIGSRVGYIDKTEVEYVFINKTQYYKVKIDELPYYDNSSGKLVEVGRLNKGFVFKRIGDYGANWHEVEIGGKKRYIAKYQTEPANSDGRNRDWDRKIASTITLKDSTIVYENIEGKLLPLAKMNGNETVFSSSPVGSTWYEIIVSGRVGYVYHTGVKPEFTSSHHYFEATLDGLPVYDNSNGRLVSVGQFKSGTIFKRVREFSTNWHEVEIGGVKRYVAKYATVPARIEQAANQANGPFLTKITLLKDYEVVENRGGKLVPILELKKGQTLFSNSTLGSNWYRVVVSGREGFIYHSAVMANALPKDVVNPYQTYTYEQMVNDIHTLAKMYPNIISTQVIGKSVDGRELIAVKLGKGSKEITVNGSHHAREHMTTNVLMEMIDQYAYAYEKNNSFSNFPTRNILDKVSIWFVPMVNPDGVTLVQKGYQSAKDPANVLRINGGSKDFSAWKANIRGVDLNRQYDANWANIVGNPGRPSPQNYKGSYPFSEPETQAMKSFVLSHYFQVGVAYHSSGEIIYWNFKQTGSQLTRDLQLANKISKLTGYSLVPAVKNPSGGGFTDWFIESQKKSAFTPEISPYVGNRPVPNSNFTDVWNRNKAVVMMLADYVYNQ